MGERGRPRGFDRTEALKRAMEVFRAHGYEGSSIADLTAAMGIASPSLYAAFGSKQQLFREAVDLFGTLGPQTKAALTAASARDAIAGMLDAAANGLAAKDGQGGGCLVVLGAVVCAPENEPVSRYVSEQRIEMCELIRRRIERAVADGELPATLDVGPVSAFYATVTQGLSIQARDGASAETLRGVAACAMAAWPTLTAG
ncbi:TetR/AcrR family transcriptional regulator [Segnochrobactrum spirostomi]|uniref:TetR/AcrR family transcriptional regulator n=1 Tax=Segnochrobactrum spirostomi TaxID=2608987 RepID=A0A6A7Y6D9_9HYPH|nr:TetR/AcrR family transcriptional regulator [Segnochrobactrum spirostomi]MQT13232.1 TetR/AcrR family transcriptional regulator [Segnochrobactrum spirostomi]